MSKFNVSCTQKQSLLLKYLEDKNETAFTELLQDMDTYDIDPNHEYKHPHYKNCLAIASSQKGLGKFVEVLLDHGADPNQISNTYDGKAPIHFAAEKGNLSTLKILVQHPHTNINAINARGKTALHLAARNLTSNENGEECFKYLAMLPSMSVSHKSLDERSAISEAIEKCSESTMRMLLQRHNLKFEDKMLIVKRYPDLEDEFSQPDSADSIYTHVDAYTDLRNGDIATFKKNMKEEFVNRTDLILTTFLQLACKKGLFDVVQLLLSYRADVNQTGIHERKPPVYIACYYGQYDILKYLIDTNTVKYELLDGKTLLHVILEGVSSKKTKGNEYQKCFNYLLQEHEFTKELNILINQGDDFGHTALHYAVQEEEDYYTASLLAHGAYIGSLNDFNISPLSDIDPKTLEKALDNCIQCTKDDKESTCTMEFNFSILNPVINCKKSVQSKNFELEGKIQERVPEMFPLFYISQSKKLQHLLKHPLLLIFLHLKWTRISILFYLNTLFYLIFVIFLTADILCDSNNCDECTGENNWNRDCSENYLSAVRIILIVLFIAFVVIESTQFVMLPDKTTFFFNVESWLELGVIITTSLILIGHCSRVLAAVALLVAWAELIMQFNCIYTLAIYNEMMKKVTFNYMKFLLWYSPLIIAFTFSFYKLYHENTSSKEKDENLASGNSTKQEDDIDFFSDISLTLLKTLVMMIGELDASSMSFGEGKYFIFLLFVFMMTIVLVNLLNGLAVSDIQAIENEAQLVTHKSKVKLVHHFESVIFGGFADGCFFTCCSQKWCGYQPIGFHSLQSCVWRKAILRIVCLFPNVLPDSCLTISLLQGGRYINRQLKTPDIEFRPDTCFTIGKYRIGFHLGREVLETAKDIASRKTDESKEIMDKINNIENSVQECEKQLTNVTKLLEELHNKNIPQN